jgi:ribulose 1,5-bisphosphate synthetase/thiazole synthase
MTASSTFDVYFVGAGHNGVIAARYLAEDSGCVLTRSAPDASQASYRAV